MATLHCAEHVHIAETQTQILMQTWIPNIVPTFGTQIRTQIGIGVRVWLCK